MFNEGNIIVTALNVKTAIVKIRQTTGYLSRLKVSLSQDTSYKGTDNSTVGETSVWTKRFKLTSWSTGHSVLFVVTPWQEPSTSLLFLPGMYNLNVMRKQQTSLNQGTLTTYEWSVLKDALIEKVKENTEEVFLTKEN